MDSTLQESWRDKCYYHDNATETNSDSASSVKECKQHSEAIIKLKI